MIRTFVGVAAVAALLAGCGTNPQDRTQGGAAAGAATGAGIGAFGGPVGALAGAAVGGTAGAITGASTAPSDVNLGKPVWNNPEVRTPAGRGTRTAASTPRRQANDGAYNGGGMVGYPEGRGPAADPNPGTGATTHTMPSTGGTMPQGDAARMRDDIGTTPADRSTMPSGSGTRGR